MSPTSAILQLLTSSDSFFMTSLVQQVQASSAVASLLKSRHFWASNSNKSTRAVHSSTKVMFALGNVAGLQVSLIFMAHSPRVVVRLASCLAPSESEDPEHVRADLFPPPTSTSLLTTGAKTSCLALFFIAISDCFSALVFCFMKLATCVFHLFIVVVAHSRHFPSTILAWALEPLFFLFLFVLFLLFLLFLFLFLPCFLLFFLLLFLFFLLFLAFLFFLLFLAFLFFLLFFLLFFFFPLPASASLTTLIEEISSERLCSSFSADAKTARATKSKEDY